MAGDPLPTRPMPTAEPIPPPPGQRPAEPVPPPPGDSTAQTVPPTRAMPGRSGQPSFQPAQPSFQPAQSPEPGGQSPRPQAPVASPPQDNWAAQPLQDTPQPGWPGAEGAGAYGAEPGPGPGPDSGQGRRRRGGGRNAYPGYPGGRPPRRRRRMRRWVMALFALIVILVLLVIGDRVALAVAENQFADQAVKSGMPVKPSVTIEGFPFLTQLAARDFKKVDISASNIPAGPVNITSVKATLNGMHLNSSFNGATVDHITATGFISFAALANAGGLSDLGGVTITAQGSDEMKITANVGGIVSDTEIAKITQTGPTTISVQVVNSGSPLSGILSSFGSFTFSIPKLPVAVHIQSIVVTPQGLTVTATADHANLTQK